MNIIKSEKLNYTKYIIGAIYLVILGHSLMHPKINLEMFLFIAILGGASLGLGYFISTVLTFVPHLKSMDESEDGKITITCYEKKSGITFDKKEVSQWIVTTTGLNITISDKTYFFLMKDHSSSLKTYCEKNFSQTAKGGSYENKYLYIIMACSAVITTIIMGEDFQESLVEVALLVAASGVCLYSLNKYKMQTATLPKSRRPVNINTTKLVVLMLAIAFLTIFDKDEDESLQTSSQNHEETRSPASVLD